MRKRKEKFIVITLFIIGIILLILPLIDNVKTISDIFKKQKLLNSLLETILMIIGMIILISLLLFDLYTKNKQDKRE